ncbi:NAD(P)H-dependent oxidoreductase [Saccharopolyspora sp. NFXS83]|uniref:NAD(P)H-dependent oxidoreductase n=1 Tax=Saccharopolyspora sp. NFXS83 TaxID=2993560 RepID=UPI00224A9093|nr:NAD(P)H-dependent oxidoreductase [Saccharopolyspora sp. NFXS83]MCX2731828.1 NAD(P)H-dependent oxidoreductase [Saccharopolyspora sp. NFXS83]
MSTVITVSSSPHSLSRLEELHRATGDALRADGFRVRGLPLNLLPESALLTGRADAPSLRWARRLLDGADGIVLITPSYEVSGSRLLRAWLDLMPSPARRPVHAVCLGSTQAQSSTADYAVRRLLTDHGAHRVAPTSFLFDKWLTSTAEGWDWDSRAARRLADGLAAFSRELNPGLPAAA